MATPITGFDLEKLIYSLYGEPYLQRKLATCPRGDVAIFEYSSYFHS